MRTVGICDGSTAFRAQVGGHGGRERAARDSDRLSGVVESRLLLGRGIPSVSLDRRVGILSREGAAGDSDLVEALVAGAVDDGDCCAVLDGAVTLGLLDRIARHGDRATRVDVQAARAHLHAHRLRVDRRVVDGQLSAAGEVDTEAVGNVERAVLQNNGVVRVVAVGLNAACGSGRGLDAIERKGRVVVRDGAAHSRRNQADEL